MKLSDAIALGRTLLTPTRATFFDGHGGGCAIGMALQAANVEMSRMFLHWPVMDKWVDLPCHCSPTIDDRVLHFTVGAAITHLFDRHVFGACDWTLDQLIDWVRTQENQRGQNGTDNDYGGTCRNQDHRQEAGQEEARGVAVPCSGLAP